MGDIVVLGGAECVWSDYEAFQRLGVPAEVMATNDTGCAVEDLDYWVTLHPEKLGQWRKRRGREDFLAFVRKLAKGCGEVEVAPEVWPGSSGLYAVQVALKELKAERVYLCGVPMTVTPHFFDDTPWKEGETYRRGWRQALPEIQGRVKSFSGWTRELLGHPEGWNHRA